MAFIRRCSLRRLALTVVFLLLFAEGVVDFAHFGGAKALGSRSLFGFSYPVGYGGFIDASTVASESTSIDSTSVLRLPVNWANLQPTCSLVTAPDICIGTPQSPNWKLLDNAVAALHQHGVRVIADINDAPDWAWGLTDCALSCSEALHEYATQSIDMPPANTVQALDDLKAFVRGFVAHYESLYPGEISAVEVWNEENDASYWPTWSGPDPFRYKNLLCAAHSGVVTVDPSLPVVIGGLSYVAGSSKPGHISIPDFLDGLYGAGGASCMTGVGLHSYPGSVEPDAPNNPYLAALGQVRATDFKDSVARQIWITEFGYCVTGSTSCASVTALEQGYYLECAYQMARGMPEVAAFSIQTLFDTSATELYGVDQSPGISRPAGSILSSLFAAYGSDVPPVSNCSASYNWPTNGP